MNMRQHVPVPHRFSYSTLFGSLALILLSALAAHAQPAAGSPSPSIWRFTLMEGTKGPGEMGLNSSCGAVEVSLKLSTNKFIRLERSGSVLLQTTRTAISLKLDATKLTPGEYSDLMTIECRYCQKNPACHQIHSTARIVLTVTPKPRAQAGTAVTAAQTTAAVKVALAALKIQYKSRIEGLEAITGRTDDGKTVTGFDAVKVREVNSWLEGQLVVIFEREGLYGMRDYIKKTFQPSPLEIVRVVTRDAHARLLLPSSGVFSTTALSFRAGGGRPAERLIATDASAKAAFKYGFGVIRYAIENSVIIKLVVRSEPDLANVVLETEDKHRFPFATNQVSDLWPGLYKLTVTKSGFVPIVQGEIDLTLHDTIECTLVKTGDAILCKIK